MKCLLDTHTLLWARSAPDLLSTQAVAALQSPSNVLHVSVASLWECAIKSSIGKLDVPKNFFAIVSEDYELLAIKVLHIELCADLPMHHRDPFDRMLVAQAQLDGLTLITGDNNIAKYDIPILAT